MIFDFTVSSIHDFISIYSLALILTGIAVGFACGLLGVGGGFLMVPVQIWALSSNGIDPTIATRVAFGTSLATILPTAFRGCHGHGCMGTVMWRPGIILGVLGSVGALFGGTVAANISGELLRVVFGVVVCVGAFRMLFSVKATPRSENKSIKENLLYYIPLGFFVGFVSGLCGIGGGVLLIPAMVILLGFEMRHAVGTSSVAIALNSIGGIVSYIINGWNVSGIPPYSLGYINLHQLILLGGAGIISASWGVRAAHRLPAERLKQIFIVLMIYVGLKMIGIFDIFGPR